MSHSPKPLLWLLAVTVLGASATAQSQMPNSGAYPMNPNSFNLEIQKRQTIDDQNAQQARSQMSKQAQIQKFMDAIKPRKHLFPDFDQVVIHSKAAVTPAMLGLIAESPYAADIAYYLGKHPGQSGAIAMMTPADARVAVHNVEILVAAETPISR